MVFSFMESFLSSVRNAVIGVIGRIPAARRWLSTELAELRYR
jgi:hypothetical protein